MPVKKTVSEEKAKIAGATPLMRQYYKIKSRHPDAILLFRMGDFYETFEQDAETVSAVLGITLTKRANGKASDVPLAGFPHHALDNYLPRLVNAGLRVAVCEQLEDPKFARKLVKRDVVEVVTPGVAFHDHLLDPKRSRYLAAIHVPPKGSDPVGLSFIDASTGEFGLVEVPEHRLFEMLGTYAPSEVLVDKRKSALIQKLKTYGYLVTAQEDWSFAYDFGMETLLRHFKTKSLKGFGIEGTQSGVIAAGAALYYLSETQKGKLPQIRTLRYIANDAYMALDHQTKRNLELINSLQSGGQDGTLVKILDHTSTPMGGRLLRHWLVRPLRKKDDIKMRLDAVEALFNDEPLRRQLRDELKGVADLERLAVKIATGRVQPRDLAALRRALQQIPGFKKLLEASDNAALKKAGRSLSLCEDSLELLVSSLAEDPPATLGDGGVIREGFDAKLDEWRALSQSGKDWIAAMQQEESEKTGIPSLKVGYNKVFGYYLEVTNAHKDKVPETYIRKQTLVNAERYITPALKEYEEKILNAQESILRLESDLFHTLRDTLSQDAQQFQENGLVLGTLDCFAGLAEVARRRNYVRPDIVNTSRIAIEQGRHPVVEATLPPGESFVSNDVLMDTSNRQILIITGPNMAGKSVFLRQVGLIVLLAQVGSFVPADAAEIGLVDRIFTRVGASDNVAAGESTFLVEMNEAANILNNATHASLLLLDEVGRGTSTFDGLSIAWSLAEYLHENESVAARTLFATHYHELNELADRYARVHNMRVQVQERDGKVIFLRKLIEGGADHSYGIEVARMAGLPAQVIRRAQEILAHLESQALQVGGEKNGAGPAATTTVSPPTTEFQMSLFTEPDPRLTLLLNTLEEINPERMTPVEALLKLIELKEKAAS